MVFCKYSHFGVVFERDQNYSKNSNIVKYYIFFYFNVFLNVIVFLAKLNFQHSLLQTSVSHDPSEIILIFLFDAQETVIIIINVKKNLWICEKKHDTFF